MSVYCLQPTIPPTTHTHTHTLNEKVSGNIDEEMQFFMILWEYFGEMLALTLNAC